MRKKETIRDRHERETRGEAIFKKLKKLFPKAGMMLTYSNNWELLVAVQLSAQCTDKKVNEITPALFAKYPTLDDYVNANEAQFQQYVYQSGFYRNKTRNILAAAKLVKHKFHGIMPRTMFEMLEIPGVGRKTANVVLGNAYGISEGIAVDTHVKRLSRLFLFSDESNPVHIEQDLIDIFPKKKWFQLTYLLIEYGRAYCTARIRDHRLCPLAQFETHNTPFPKMTRRPAINAK